MQKISLQKVPVALPRAWGFSPIPCSMSVLGEASLLHSAAAVPVATGSWRLIWAVAMPFHGFPLFPKVAGYGGAGCCYRYSDCSPWGGAALRASTAPRGVLYSPTFQQCCVGASPGDLTEIGCLRCLCLSALVFLFRNRRCVILSSCALYALPSADKCTVWFCSLCWTPELCVAVLRGREHREPLEPGFSNYQRMF